MAEPNPENIPAAQHQALTDRDELVERYRPYVYSIVKQIRNTFPVNTEFEELVNYGMIGLLEAADRYDPRRKIAFTTFSYYRIRGAIFDGLREMGIINRTSKDSWARREAVLNDLVQTTADDNVESAAATVDDEISGIERAVDFLIPAYLLSLSDENAPDLPDTSALPDEVLESSEILTQVRQAVGDLPEKEKQIIESLYFKHLSSTELAKQMGVNKSWVSRLHAKAVTRLKQRLDLIGITAGGKSP